jgi:hypothetical protein
VPNNASSSSIAPAESPRGCEQAVPLALQVDLDGLWAVRQCYGQPIEDTFSHDPVYFEALPRFLDLLDELKLPATFFVVGKDTEVPEKRALLLSIHQRGHEIANHAYSHVLGLTALRENEIADEIISTQEAVNGITGVYPVGFRAPGYDVNERVLNLLRDLEFAYDTSLFPTPFGFVFRAIDRYLSRRLRTGKRQYGRLRHAFAPLAPYFPHPDSLLEKITHPEFIGRDGHIMMEIPVSVSPSLRLPMHCGIALTLGVNYFKRCAERFLHRRIPLVYLFHGIDLVDTSRHQVFPGSRRGGAFFRHTQQEKERLIREILQYLASNFRPTLTRNLLNECQSPTQPIGL